jgi:hypothetical protein
VSTTGKILRHMFFRWVLGPCGTSTSNFGVSRTKSSSSCISFVFITSSGRSLIFSYSAFFSRSLSSLSLTFVFSLSSFSLVVLSASISFSSHSSRSYRFFSFSSITLIRSANLELCSLCTSWMRSKQAARCLSRASSKLTRTAVRMGWGFTSSSAFSGLGYSSESKRADRSFSSLSLLIASCLSSSSVFTIFLGGI